MRQRRFFRLIAVAIAAVCLPHGREAIAQVSVEVSSTYSAIAFAYNARLASRHIVTADLLSTPNNDRYYAVVRPQGSLRVFVIDGRDIAADNPKPVFPLNRIVAKPETIDFPPLPSSLGLAAVFKNEGYFPLDISITVFRVGQRPPAAIARVKELVEISIGALDLIYQLPKFTVSVRPCGTINAYSTPNVVICTELIADLFERKLMDALHPILLHEVGHSLLYLWGLPGYDNEDIVDEFAAAFIANSVPHALEAYVKWLESKDSVTEALVQLVAGGRHTVSVQRARNMRSVLANRDQVLQRWARLLGPYRKKPPQ